MTTQDFTKTWTEMFAKFPGDMNAMNDMFKSSTDMMTRMSNVALTAADQSADITSKWTKDSIAKLSAMTKTPTEPADYSKAMTDFASASFESAAEHMAAYAEVAKKVQIETVELMLAAGKDAQEEATAAIKKATSAANDVAKKTAKAA